MGNKRSRERRARQRRPRERRKVTEPAQEVAFAFYDGELFQIAVSYDWTRQKA
jgi:hypothetical protein